MGARSAAREAALQMLFALEFSGADGAGVPVDETIRLFWREMPGDPEDRAYADELVRGVAAARAALDDELAAVSRNWRVARMPRVDRNVLRLGTWELLHSTSVPRPVAIDEAVELAKRFGGEKSPQFINGLLDRVAERAGRRRED